MKTSANPQVATDAPSATDSLPMLALRLREAMLRRLRPYFRAQDLTEQQWRVLRMVAIGSGGDMQAVARLACIQPPSLSRIMRKLVGRGLVQRLSAEVDQRRVQVRLTPDGEAMVATLGPVLWRAYAEVVQMMGPDNVTQASALMLGMLNRLPQQDADAPEDEED